MALKQLMSNKKIRMYWADTNKDFIKLLAVEAVNYHNHPIVDDFCQEHSSAEELYEIARGIVTIPGLVSKRGIIYHQDPRGLKMEKFVSPVRIIKRLNAGKKVTGDCDDKTNFLATCLLNRGYEVRVIGAHYIKEGSAPGSINHVYLEFRNPGGKWIPLDPSAKTGVFGIKPPSVYAVVKFKAIPEMLSIKKVAENVMVHESIESNIKEDLWQM